MWTRVRFGAIRWHRILLVAALFPLLGGSAESVPAYARRYALPCHFCHDGYPKLSVLGEQFKERGYRLENDRAEAADWLRSIPVSFRGTFRQSFEERADAASRGIFRIVSSGNLGSRLSYWVDEGYSVHGGGFDRGGTGNAFLRFEIFPDELYLRGGRIELDLPFTQARTPQLFAYEIYFANTGFETDDIGSYHHGLEAGGFLDDDTRWSLSIVAGRNSDEQAELLESSPELDGNLFGRLARRFGEDRAGAYLYWGRNRLARAKPDPSPGGPEVLEWSDSLFRLGLDGSLYLARAHLYGTFLYGRNGNSLADARNPNGTREPLSFTGGFAQLDYTVRDPMVLSARLDWVDGPPPGTAEPARTLLSFSPGIKLWLHPRIRLAFELNFRNRSRPTRGAIQVDLAL